MKIWVRLLLVSAVLLPMLTGCKSVYYGAWEKVGVHKRDLLKKNVTAARDDQKEAGEKFTDALTRLQQLYGFEGGDLEKGYRRLESDYNRAAAQADDVRKRVAEVEEVANDLFEEWEKELEEITSSELRSRSRAQLQQTRIKYRSLYMALKRAEQSMEPVLTQLRDHVLFLKHNLNAQAIGSLRGEATTIQKDIADLVEEMNQSIKRADEFIQTLGE